MKFDPLLVRHGILKSEHDHFRKWLRYYFDFCQKYHFPESNPESLPLFIKKLQEKHQSATQQKQAAVALSLYYAIVRSDPDAHLSESEHSREKSQPSRKQQHIGSPVSCDDSITQPKAIDDIRDDQAGVPNFPHQFHGNEHGSPLPTRRGSPAPTHRVAAPPLAIDSQKTVAYDMPKGGRRPSVG